MKEKLLQVKEILKKNDIECWIILSREGKEKTIELLLEREFIGGSAFIFAKDRRIAVVASYDRDRVEEMEIFTYTKGIREVLPRILKEISPARIHMNFSEHDHAADSLTHGLFLAFQGIMKEIDFGGEILSSEIFLDELRSVKTEEEHGRIREAVRITEEIFREMPEFIKEGMTEKEVLGKMIERARLSGCELAWSDPTVTFGIETALGHRICSDRKLKRNESIHTDFGVRYEGYCSDLQRVFFFGVRPPDAMVEAFNTIRHAQDESIQFIRSGKMGFEVDTVARRIMTEASYPEYNHGLGHQIGREVHDGGCILGPLWERYEKNARKPIREGNVFTIEPTITSEKINIGLEDDIIVREEGAELLSHPQKEIILV
jgi:Xaa-Pro aminopeptidase